MIKRLILISVALTLSSAVHSQPYYTDNYRIEVSFSDLSEEDVILGYHMGSKQYIIDSATLDASGKAVFQGNDSLRYGVYLIYVPDVKYFDFIFNEPEVILSTSIDDPVADMKVIKSNENEVFFDYLNKLNGFSQQVSNASISDSEKQEINDKVMTYIRETVIRYPQLFVTSLINANRQINVPDVDEAGNQVDDNWKYNYYYEHYWDYIDLSDERLIFSPTLENKINEYITQLTIQNPDSIIAAADRLITAAGEKNEMYRYIVIQITNTFANYRLMIAENVYVHMIDTYYSLDKAWWLEEETLYRMQDQAERLRPLLIGKRMPNHSFTTPEGKRKDIINTASTYTVLYFYDTSCDRCIEGIDKINEQSIFYRENDIALWGVRLYEDESWGDFIQRHGMKDWVNVEHNGLQEELMTKYNIQSTPAIIVIDENKDIVLRRISPSQLHEVLSLMIGDN